MADEFVRNYSGGMIRRLEIAQSMLDRPRGLFLDEPTVGLDPGARGAVWEHVERRRGEYGTTIVLTTHLMDEAEAVRFVDKTLVIAELEARKLGHDPTELTRRGRRHPGGGADRARDRRGAGGSPCGELARPR